MAAVLSEIYVEPQAGLRDDEDLKQSLRDEGVRIGYPYCQVSMTSEDKVQRIARIFRHYGWSFEVVDGHYEAYQNEEDIRL